MLDWCWASFDWPSSNQQWAATLAKYWAGIGWVGLHRVCVCKDMRQVDSLAIWILNRCWPAPVMVVEGIHIEDIFKLVSLVFFPNYIQDIYDYGQWGSPIQLYTIQNIKPNFCLWHLNRLNPVLGVRDVLVDDWVYCLLSLSLFYFI